MDVSMSSSEVDLETVLRRLVETNAFMELGNPDAGTLTWPSEPLPSALKWPVVVLKCSRGHELGFMNLSFDRESQRWAMHSDADLEAMPGGLGNRDPRPVVSLIRTDFSCSTCQRRHHGRAVNVRLSGSRLVLLYAEAVVTKKTVLRLP